MIRSIAASMESSLEVMSMSGLKLRNSNGPGGLELRNGLVGEPDLVEFAAVKHLHDDLQQPVVGDERIGNGAGLAQVIRRDGIGIADRLDIHHLQAALDQHAQVLRYGLIKRKA